MSAAQGWGAFMIASSMRMGKSIVRFSRSSRSTQRLFTDASDKTIINLSNTRMDSSFRLARCSGFAMQVTIPSLWRAREILWLTPQIASYQGTPSGVPNDA